MYIYSMGHYWPDTVLDNHFYSQLDIESDAQWIEDRVGIKTRRSVLSHESILDMRFGRATRQQLKDQGKIQTITDMSERSWQMARDRFPIVLDAIDTVIGGTSVPDDDIPSSACTIAAQIGMERVRAFDVTSACATFVVQCHVMRGLMKSGLTREGAIFCAERYTTRLDYSDRKNCILFGDGAVAASISADPKSGSLKVIDTMIESAPSGWEHIHMPDGRTFHQNGAAVQKFAVTKTIAAAQDILARNGLAAHDANGLSVTRQTCAC
jgi:3-oxoacyl-[acyl-carrier-protein] synthase-3